jgi:hypothetical protein
MFEHLIYPHQKCEAEFLLLVGCLVVVLREPIAHAIEAFYLSFVNVCMSIFSEEMMSKQVVCFQIILSSRV